MIPKERNGNSAFQFLYCLLKTDNALLARPTLILHRAPILPTLTPPTAAPTQTLVQTRIQVPTRGVHDRRNVQEQTEKVGVEVAQEDGRLL